MYYSEKIKSITRDLETLISKIKIYSFMTRVVREILIRAPKV